MTIETVLLSKNRDLFNRIITFMRSLVIKNEAEAELAETTDSLAAYNLYAGAYEEHDSVLDYKFSKEQLLPYGFLLEEAIEYVYNPNKLQSLVMNGEARAVSFINDLRKKRRDSFIEQNTYYRQFSGYPQNKEEFILVKNDDKKNDLDPEIIYLHQVKYENYPKTYNRLFYERDFDKILKEYNYTYLKFIEKPLIPYKVRNYLQFEILYYDNILTGNELPYFFEAYNIARQEILNIDYIEAFETTYTGYVALMLTFVLYYTFNIFCCKLLEKYAVRDYTDDEIYDILDSNGLSNLKSLNISLLKRLILRLPELKNSLGTNKSIKLIFDIVADKTLSVKRLYLRKKYNIDTKGNTVVTENGLYSDNVDVVFAEKTVIQGEEASFVVDNEYPYEEIVMQDDTWGGTQDISDLELKKQIKKEMKENFLSEDFSSIITKYITLSKIINMYSKLIDVTDKLGLFYQINEERNNFLKDDTLIFQGMEITALSIYGAWCLIYATLNGVTNPDYIVKDVCSVEGVMRLRKYDKLNADILKQQDVVIDLGNGFKRTVGDYLSEKEIRDLMVSFNYDQTTDIHLIIDQYDENRKIIDYIEEKLLSVNNYGEYEMWNAMKNANIISKRIENLFSGYVSYSSYIKNNDPEFYEFIEPYITDPTIGTTEALTSLCEDLKNAYNEYIYDKSGVQGSTDEEDIAGGENLEEIGILFNEFMSCFTQIFKQDFHVGYDDPSNNSLILLYSHINEVYRSEDTDLLELLQSVVTDTLYDKGTICYLELLYYGTDTTKQEIYFDLFLDYSKIKDIFKLLFYEGIELNHKFIKDTSISQSFTNLSLEDSIKDWVDPNINPFSIR